MKPSRKLSRRSFVTLVSGGDPSGLPGAPLAGGKAAGDHDLIGPGSGGGGADPDSGPQPPRK